MSQFSSAPYFVTKFALHQGWPVFSSAIDQGMRTYGVNAYVSCITFTQHFRIPGFIVSTRNPWGIDWRAAIYVLATPALHCSLLNYTVCNAQGSCSYLPPTLPIRCCCYRYKWRIPSLKQAIRQLYNINIKVYIYKNVHLIQYAATSVSL
ncbi:hypothetical protein XENTR_v10019278 [Xenopus tropicalis]|nr:hypothetical protein XENTR_v10019278 [Xenopus tropicalis]